METEKAHPYIVQRKSRHTDDKETNVEMYQEGRSEQVCQISQVN